MLNTEKARARRTRLLAAGLCRACGKVPPIEGQQLCPVCRGRIKDWQRENAAQFRASQRDWARRRRLQVLERYGGRCTCCGETTPQFLALDHVNGGGNAHRRADGGRLYDWAVKHGYPDILQVLCHNCNMAKAFYGTCPHKQA